MGREEFTTVIAKAVRLKQVCTNPGPLDEPTEPTYINFVRRIREEADRARELRPAQLEARDNITVKQEAENNNVCGIWYLYSVRDGTSRLHKEDGMGGLALLDQTPAALAAALGDDEDEPDDGDDYEEGTERLMDLQEYDDDDGGDGGNGGDNDDDDDDDDDDDGNDFAPGGDRDDPLNLIPDWLKARMR